MIKYQNFRDLPYSKCKERDVIGDFSSDVAVFSTSVTEGAPGVKIRLTVSWLGTGYEENTAVSFNNQYIVKIVDNNGNAFAEATCKNSTTVFIYYPMPSVADYHIKVYQIGVRMVAKDRLAVSYYTYR